MSKKYEYKVIEPLVKFSSWSEDYDKIINEYAAEGWRLKQAVRSYNSNQFDKLVFEREINS